MLCLNSWIKKANLHLSLSLFFIKSVASGQSNSARMGWLLHFRASAKLSIKAESSASSASWHDKSWWQEVKIMALLRLVTYFRSCRVFSAPREYYTSLALLLGVVYKCRIWIYKHCYSCLTSISLLCSPSWNKVLLVVYLFSSDYSLFRPSTF